VSELIEHESWNFPFLQKIWALWFYVHLLHARLWLEGHAKELLEPHGDLCNIVCYSVLLLDVDSASSEKNTHSGMLFSSNTEPVFQNSSTIMCNALLHSSVLTRDWLLQNFNRIVSMTHTCTSRSIVYECHSTEYSSEVHWGHLDSATCKKWLVHCSLRFSSENAIAMWASVPTHRFSTQRATVNLSVHTGSTVNVQMTLSYMLSFEVYYLTTLSVGEIV